MNKKILIITCIILFSVAICNLYLLQKNIFSKSTLAINVNWNIPFSLPINDKDIYKEQWPKNGPDGYYYYIAKYEAKDKIEKMNKINWSKSIDDVHVKILNDFYQKIDISSKYKISLKEKLLYYVQDDNDDILILIYNNKSHYLYILEKII